MNANALCVNGVFFHDEREIDQSASLQAIEFLGILNRNVHNHGLHVATELLAGNSKGAVSAIYLQHNSRGGVALGGPARGHTREQENRECYSQLGLGQVHRFPRVWLPIRAAGLNRWRQFRGVGLATSQTKRLAPELSVILGEFLYLEKLICADIGEGLLRAARRPPNLERDDLRRFAEPDVLL